MKAIRAATGALALTALVLACRDGTPSGADLGHVDSFRAALAERDPLTRSYQLSAFLQQLRPDQVPEMLEILEQRRVGVTEEEIRLLMLAWTRFDAPGAFAWARDWPTGWKRQLMETAAYAWGFRDGPAALRAVETLSDSELQESLRGELVAGWIRSDDRLGASAYIATIPDQKRRNRLGFLLAGEARRDGVDAVIGWAEAVPADSPNNFKQIAFYHAAGSVARADPSRAAEWYEAHRQRPYSVTALKEIARKWARHHDPESLLDWIRSLPADDGRGRLRGEALGAAASIWMDRDPEACQTWLRSALPDPALDSAIAEVARGLSDSSPRAAVDWAERIEDENERRKSRMQAARSWWKADPDAVRHWLAASDLPEDVQQAILRGVSSASGRRAGAPPAQPPTL
jgi:hypothetical protein